VIFRLGPRGAAVYGAVLDRIEQGIYPIGWRLPSHTELAAEFGVAVMTVRHALSMLEDEGYVSRQHGRGTFVQAPSARTVLIVDDEHDVARSLGRLVAAAGLRPVLAYDPGDALASLEMDPGVGLVLSDVRMPTPERGLAFIRQVRRRWPNLPLAAVTGYVDDLAGLHGTPDSPLLVLAKPVRARQIAEVLRLAGLRDRRRAGEEKLPVLVADGDPVVRSVIRDVAVDLGHAVEEAADGARARRALAERTFGHVFLDPRMPGGGVATVAAIVDAHPRTVVVVTASCPEMVLRDEPSAFVTILQKPVARSSVEKALRLRRTV
jgi:CheY-like chemotaxis protein